MILRDEEFMRVALAVAAEGVAAGQTPFGACLVRDGRVLCRAHNAVWATTDITAHAEVRAIRMACGILGTIDLSGCSMYTTCEPCPMCFSACHWARIDRIVYGAEIADARAVGFHELTIPCEEMQRLGGSSVQLQAGTLRADVTRLMHAWAADPHHRTY